MNLCIKNSIAVLVLLTLAPTVRADDCDLSQTGNSSAHFGIFTVSQFEPLPGALPLEADVFPEMPVGFVYPDDIDFVANMSNLTSIFPGVITIAGGTAHFGVLQNGNYAVVQDVTITYTGSGSLNFSNVVLVFDFFSNAATAISQIMPTADPDNDFDMVFSINPGGPLPFNGLKLPLGFVIEDVPFDELADSVLDRPLRGWRLSPVGELFKDESALITIGIDTGVVAVCTFAGTDVVSVPVDFTTLDTPVTVTYDEVTEPGNTTLETFTEGPPPPSGFKVGNPPTYFDLQTTATFTGEVEVCIDYSGISFGNESALKLFHFEDGEWVDATSFLDTDNDIICAAVTSFSLFAIFEFEDADNDGLTDTDEITFGTDPNDPDSDDDGLLDGTEVDTAEGSGCPDPLNPDSDDDNIVDGVEVDTGTDPCNPDTDNDGIPDDLDPFPLDPGGTPDSVELELRDLAVFVDALDLELGLIDAPNNNAAKGRRNAMSNKLTSAANAVAAGDIDSAIDQLLSLLAKLDGDPQPKDWMTESPERDALVLEIEILIILLEFL